METLLVTAGSAFLMVVGALVLLTGAVVTLRALGRLRVAPTPADESNRPDPRLVVVLAAAAHAALGAPVRIHHVHVHRGPAVEAWSRAGRMDIMLSHKLEPKR